MDETTQNDAATLGRVFFNKLKSAAAFDFPYAGTTRLVASPLNGE